MAGKTFVAVDRESLDKALAEADAHDRIVVAEGAFDAIPRLAVDGARWRLNGWTARPTGGVTVPPPRAITAAMRRPGPRIAGLR